MRQKFDETDIAAFAAPLKFAFVGAMNDEGFPHFNLINTLEVFEGDKLTFAKSYHGQTKLLLEKHGKGGFFSLSLDLQYYDGRIKLLRMEDMGELKEYYSQKPGTRYSAYFNVEKVYVCAVEGFEGPVQLVPDAVLGNVMGFLPKLRAYMQDMDGAPLSGYTAEILSRNPNTMGKILAWEDAEGYPAFAPLFEAFPAGTGRVAFPVCDERIADIPDGAKVTLQVMQLTTMEGFQIRGILHKHDDNTVGTIDVVNLYNSMLFHPAVYWPMEPYKAVVSF
jgi:hypothetical protein